MTRHAGWLLLPAVLAGCASAGAGSPDDATPTPTRASTAAAVEIPERLHSSAEAWNRGDLNGFLAPYLDASETTFVGGSGLVRGLDRVRAGYRASYWQDGGPPETLSFDGLEVRPLDPGHALVTGRYILEDPATGRTAADGFFTLVWRWTDDGWRIIHDHSSASGS